METGISKEGACESSCTSLMVDDSSFWEAGEPVNQFCILEVPRKTVWWFGTNTNMYKPTIESMAVNGGWNWRVCSCWMAESESSKSNDRRLDEVGISVLRVNLNLRENHSGNSPE